MMWAADFNEDVILHLEENCLEPLLVDMRNDLSCEVKEEHRVNSYTRRKSKSRKPHHRNGEMRVACNLGMKPNTRNPLCGLSGATIWARHQQMPHISTNVLAKNGDDDLPIFCVAAILVINRHKIIRETRSIDDAIKASLSHNFLSYCLQTSDPWNYYQELPIFALDFVEFILGKIKNLLRQYNNMLWPIISA